MGTGWAAMLGDGSALPFCTAFMRHAFVVRLSKSVTHSIDFFDQWQRAVT